MSKLKSVILGALGGSLLASTFALLNSRQTLVKKIRAQTQDWPDKVRNVRENIFEDMYSLTESRSSRRRKIFIGGALLGILMGACSSALLTPKTGRQLRKDLTQKYHGMAHKTHDLVEFINKNGYRKPLKKIARVLATKRRLAKSRR